MRVLFRLLPPLLLGCLLPMQAMASANFNLFTRDHCAAGTIPAGAHCETVQQGDTWTSRYPDADTRDLAQRLSRQNVSLRTGQQVIVMSPRTNYAALSPLPMTGHESYDRVLVFDPRPSVLAWALYEHGQQVAWGPAVGGKDWCPDVGRQCRTKVGVHAISEIAGPDRRSGAYPRLWSDEYERKVACSLVDWGRCAKMPYFMRITDFGQGFHARDMHGKNASHGCIGLLHADAVWLNTQKVHDGMTVIVLPYERRT